MTEEERELEQKIKQYQYQLEEAEKNLEKIHKDTHTRKKSFTVVLGRILGTIVFVWAGIGFIILGFFLYTATANLVRNLNSFDPVKAIEHRYDINLKSMSREVDDTTLIYKVKIQKWKYRKVRPTVVREGMELTYDDIEDRCIKYIIENIEHKQLLDGFEIVEFYEKYDILKYNITYKLKTGENKQSAENKVKVLQQYVLNYDKINKKFMKNINEKIKLIER